MPKNLTKSLSHAFKHLRYAFYTPDPKEIRAVKYLEDELHSGQSVNRMEEVIQGFPFKFGWGSGCHARLPSLQILIEHVMAKQQPPAAESDGDGRVAYCLPSCVTGVDGGWINKSHSIKRKGFHAHVTGVRNQIFSDKSRHAVHQRTCQHCGIEFDRILDLVNHCRARHHTYNTRKKDFNNMRALHKHFKELHAKRSNKGGNLGLDGRSARNVLGCTNAGF